MRGDAEALSSLTTQIAREAGARCYGKGGALFDENALTGPSADARG